MDLSQVSAAAPVTGDEALVRAQVERLYERRGRELWGLARRLGASDEQAADAVQEAHLRLWRELGRGASITDPEAWLFRVIYRVVMDEHRLTRRVRAVLTRIAGTQRVAMEGVEDRVSLWPLVDRLAPRERATLYLRYRADLSFDQIGAAMGITAAAARTYASRGIERLRAMLAGGGEINRA